jgi:hypothetical protein
LAALKTITVHGLWRIEDIKKADAGGTQPSGKKKKGSGKKANGKSSGKASAEASGGGTTDASEFSCANFVQAANTLAESMKEKREHPLSRVIIY